VSWLSQFEFLGTGLAGSDYMDLIVRRGYEDDCLAAMASRLQESRVTVAFEHLPADSLASRLGRLLTAGGWTMTTGENGTCPIVPLAGHSFESYLGTLGSSHRANFRRRLKALEQKFHVRFEQVSSEADRDAVLPMLAGFSQRRWRDQGGSSAFATPDIRAFQNEATRLALASGWLRLYVLRLDGDVAAVMYGFLYNDRFYFYQHGFDERFRDASVGLVLMGLSIRAALEEGAREFDMLWGVEPYKFLWARRSAALHRVDLFPPHVGGVLHRRALDTRRRVRRLARRVLSVGESLGS
jgi:CelD/BcsL family acetyltransferase involved in cellulose biosynthesis